METTDKTAPLEAARKFIDKHFPDCDGALMAGSAVRGEATATSDLDIVVFDSKAAASYRESLIAFDWPIEVFVHNLTSYQAFFQSDAERARPSMPRMVYEGLVLRDTGIIDAIKQDARDLLASGPQEWTAAAIRTKRYFLTDTLDDFIGCSDRAEGIFIAGTLAEGIAEFELRTHGRWIGASKWIVRSLKEYDKEFTARFVDAFDHYYRHGNKEKVIELADTVLQPHGGRLFEGFSMGKDKS
ncbi:nucleotidyltransferase domain-containing protein [Planococcus halotolerans]|uniref:nucleotidyltransferase domain-containing protein n=1 Tax=Planococcus halotolerans TaxID=2233542 RepID=UPI00109235FA|nr:nucleotidyltransferase domain-containing protein [Planococcus halotolerans]QHJ70167.1 nucleotidyltransferase domain-containing protein [Planococcus halotolerans]